MEHICSNISPTRGLAGGLDAGEGKDGRLQVRARLQRSEPFDNVCEGGPIGVDHGPTLLCELLHPMVMY